jgi:hypothetical protein
MSVGARISVRALMRILEPNLDATFLLEQWAALVLLDQVSRY